MLNIYVIDLTAESRNEIIGEINNFIQRDIQDNFLLPRINLKPLAVSEIRFHGAPDVCIVGNELVSQELTQLAELRKLFPESAILVKTRAGTENISIFEQFARLGVDDTLSERITALEFFRKIILLTKHRKKVKSGQLILIEGAKRGLGVTSLAAATAEILHAQGKKVLLADLDNFSQDLSRFLLVKPFINENLQYLFDQRRPICEDTVKQCFLPVWQDDDRFFCMPPVSESDDIYDTRSHHARILLSIFDILDRMFDYVVIDIGGSRGSLARTLYRIADILICVVNNDPAALYAGSTKISQLKAGMAVNAKLRILECTSHKKHLSSSVFRSEITRVCNLEEEAWLPHVVPFCGQACRWPGSGSTMYSAGGRAIKRALFGNLQALNLIDSTGVESLSSRFFFGKSKLKALIEKEGQFSLPETGAGALLELPGPDDALPRVDLHRSGEMFEDENEPLVSNVRIN